MTRTDGFVDVELVTAGGVYVSTARIPKLNPMPGALIWGARFFVRKDMAMRYHEAFCYIVPLENMYHPRDPQAGKDTRAQKP